MARPLPEKSSKRSRGDARRAEILRTARGLFNERGAQAVSTNHIASALEISVGNLYWHFADKETIVRALYREAHARFDGIMAPPATPLDAVHAVVETLRRAFANAWEYRFLYRELAVLVRADSQLRRMHAHTRDERRAELLGMQRAFVALGILRFPDEATLERVNELSWMITTQWIPHVDLRDETLTKRAVLEGARAVLALYVPYAAPQFARAFGEALSELGKAE